MKRIFLVGALVMIGAIGNPSHLRFMNATPRQVHSTADRGAMVMGFDQTKTTHHFHLYEDGGAIEVTINDANDIVNRNAIRSHLPHIAQMFATGDFDAPMEVHAQHVPGTSELSALKDRVSYKYIETPKGGLVEIVTKDADALKAVHEFLKFQIADHKTGDLIRVTKRPAGTRP